MGIVSHYTASKKTKKSLSLSERTHTHTANSSGVVLDRDRPNMCGNLWPGPAHRKSDVAALKQSLAAFRARSLELSVAGATWRCALLLLRMLELLCLLSRLEGHLRRVCIDIWIWGPGLPSLIQR